MSNLCEPMDYVNKDNAVKKMAPLLAFLVGRVTCSKSHIAAFLHVFSPGRAQTFFPVWALFGTTSAGEWAGLAVFIAHR